MDKHLEENKKSIVKSNPGSLSTRASDLVQRGLKYGDALTKFEGHSCPKEPLYHFKGISDRSCAAISESGDLVVIRNYGMYGQMHRKDFHFLLVYPNEGLVEEVSIQPDVPTNPFMFNYIYSVAISPDNTIIASGSAYGDVYLWDLKKRKRIFTIGGKFDVGSVNYLRFSSNGDLLVAYGNSGLNILEINTGRIIYRLPCSRSSSLSSSISLSRIGPFLLCRYNDELLRYIDYIKARVIQEFRIHSGIEGVTVSLDDTLALVGCNDGTLYLWDLEKSNLIHKWTHGSGDREEGEIFQLSKDKTVKIHKFLRSKSTVVAIAPNNKKALSAIWQENELIIWDIASGNGICHFSTSSGVTRARFLPDGKRVLAACWDGSVYLWNIETLEASTSNEKT
jgi:WD40 repeat protein